MSFVNTHVSISFEWCMCHTFRYLFRQNSHRAYVYLTLVGNNKLFSKLVVSVYPSINKSKRISSCHLYQIWCYFSHSGECEIVFHCGFNFHFHISDDVEHPSSVILSTFISIYLKLLCQSWLCPIVLHTYFL
jgi:hypothetical protein